MRRFFFSRRARRLLAVLLLGLTAYVLWQALTPSPGGPSLPWDKVNHALAFAVLTLVGRFAGLERPRIVIELVVAGIALGIGIELGQLFVPNRSSEVEDVVADCVGIGLGLAVAALVLSRLERRRRRRLPPGSGAG